MNSHELARRLLSGPDVPVVMSQEDLPEGCYGVLDVDVRDMQRDEGRLERPEVWHDRIYARSGFDLSQRVVFLDSEPPRRQVIDAEPDVVALGCTESPSAAVATPAVEEPINAEGAVALREGLTMAAALARLDASVALCRCFVCDKPSEALMCDVCAPLVGR